jgi:mannose-6-phosphate isomerase
MTLHPVRLLPSYREKIWGDTALEPWFRASSEKIGEVWFAFDDNQTESGRTVRELMKEYGRALTGADRDWDSFPILVKFLFTSDRLSVQVHPDDEHARLWENFHGKAEMWHVLRAEPGAAIALGLKEAITRERLREASLSGEIEALIRWVPVHAGDTILALPGTVHAIGPGLALCEIQQNCDLTYRLYDYGRPRELHLDKAIAMANLGPHPGPLEPVELGPGRRLLACCPHFATEALEFGSEMSYEPDPGRAHLLIVIDGSGAIDGRRFSPGEVWLVPAAAAPFPIAPERPARLLRTYVPPRC